MAVEGVVEGLRRRKGRRLFRDGELESERLSIGFGQCCERVRVESLARLCRGAKARRRMRHTVSIEWCNGSIRKTARRRDREAASARRERVTQQLATDIANKTPRS
jgi:hypothetical protein